MNSPEVKLLNRNADDAAAKLTQPQAAAWLVDTSKRWADVIAKAKISLDGYPTGARSALRSRPDPRSAQLCDRLLDLAQSVLAEVDVVADEEGR